MAESRGAVVDDDADTVQSVSGGGDHLDVCVYHKRFCIISGERMNRVHVLVGHAETDQVGSFFITIFFAKIEILPLFPKDFPLNYWIVPKSQESDKSGFFGDVSESVKKAPGSLASEMLQKWPKSMRLKSVILFSLF